ncbi:GNAT family N-acetyltransferase [Falsibacillus pallidus]|uniref:GNAT family N-acetyltransferase n=1 Tax=Falsibacillus pallidus TaxID=493781 RepID=UPI003D97D89F
MKVIRQAESLDLEKLESFLTAAGLSTEGVKESIDYFLLIENEQGKIFGTMGIEPFETSGLLRSLVVVKEMGEEGLLTLFQQMFKLAKERGLSTLYLATNKPSSLSFLAWMGFSQVDKSDLPPEIGESAHGSELLTNAQSTFMKLSL